MLNTNTGETQMKAEMQNQNYQFRLVNAAMECESDYPHIFLAHCHKTYRYIVMKQVAERYKVTIKDLKNLTKQSFYAVEKIRSKRSKESKDGTRFALMYKGRVVKFITQEEYKNFKQEVNND